MGQQVDQMWTHYHTDAGFLTILVRDDVPGLADAGQLGAGAAWGAGSWWSRSRGPHHQSGRPVPGADATRPPFSSPGCGSAA
ncbi:hypothetical protein ABPG77_002719 [Micractinium sp. CCAP 211/92]